MATLAKKKKELLTVFHRHLTRYGGIEEEVEKRTFSLFATKEMQTGEVNTLRSKCVLQ